MRLIQRDLYMQAREQSISSRERITELVRPLAPDKLTRRADPKSWSVAENLEHLCISDELLDGPVRRAIAAARADAGAPLREWKSTLLGGLIARSLVSPRKIKTPRVFEPPAPRGGILEAFRQMDQSVVQMMDDAIQLDWRAVRVKSPALPPFAPGYNLGDVFYIHAVHTARHAGQIARTIETL